MSCLLAGLLAAMRDPTSPAWAGPAAALRAPSHDPRSGPVAVMRGTLKAEALIRSGPDARAFSEAAAALDMVLARDLPTCCGADPAVETAPDRHRLTPAGRWPIESGGTAIAVTPHRPAPLAEVDEQRATRSRGGTIPRRAAFRTGAGVDDPIALCEIGSPID